MTRQEELTNTIKVLRKEVEVLTSRRKPAGTGYLVTAIDVINGRIDELMKEITAPYFGEEDVYDGYKEHTEAMEQARLKKIQDYNSGNASFKKSTMWSANKEGHWSPDENIEEKHVPDTVKHTEAYYDTQRNRPMTVSEQMQEELEPLPDPLPINTFK